MKLYEYVDEFIVATAQGIGDEFRKADIDAWAVGEGYEFNVSAALQIHRQSPTRRAFTTERIGLGKNTFYRVVETASGRVAWAAVQRINQQKLIEAINGWHGEAVSRMEPLAARDSRAMTALKEAYTTMRAVAAVVTSSTGAMRPDWLDELDEE